MGGAGDGNEWAELGQQLSGIKETIDSLFPFKLFVLGFLSQEVPPSSQETKAQSYLCFGAQLEASFWPVTPK